MSWLTRNGNFAGRFSRNDAMPSRASPPPRMARMPRVSILCASIGWLAAAIFHNIWRHMETETAELLSAISRARARAAGNRSSGSWRERTNPPSSASCASNTRPVRTHSQACCNPTTLGRNQLLHASITRPRRAKTKPNRALVEARRISIGNCMVTPTPTAGPFTAAIIGFLQS